jgi:hypothetical protein
LYETDFLEELFGGLLERLFRYEQAGAGLAAQFEVPVLGHLLGEREAFLVCARAALLAADGGGALPEAAVGTPIDLKLSA